MKKVIKITENQFRNIIENSILKEHSVFNDPKALALVNFLNDTEQEEEYGLSEIIPLKYDHYGLSMYKVKDREYAVGTDEEANKAAADEIKETMWAFNKDFIIEHSSILAHDKSSEELLDCIQEANNNEIIIRLIDNIDEFIEDAIQSDGRGHSINSYDGKEHEKELNGNYYYIYRIN